MANLKIIEKPYLWLRDNNDSRFNVLYGGASSGKSWTLSAYLIIEKLYTQAGIGIAAYRKTMPSVRLSCLRLCRYWLDRLGKEYHENRSNMTIHVPNGSFIQFGGLDDVEKLKSLERINYIWIEEATEIKHKDLLQLALRCRAKNPYQQNQLFLTFNPVDPIGNAWLEKMTLMAPEGKYLGSTCRMMLMTHTDNPFLSKEEHAVIEALADIDVEYNKIYRLGQWATPTRIIYSNWDIVPNFPDERDLDEIGYGLDFGYVHPSALLKIGIKENHIYVQEELYESGLHNQDLILQMTQLIPSKYNNKVIMADSARPEYIEEIHAAGFNCHGVIKAPGDMKGFVATGIDRCKRVRLHITESSANVIKEIRGYKWKTDKNDNSLDEPVKFNDHAMDALRYYLYTVLKEQEEVETVMIQTPDWWR